MSVTFRLYYIFVVMELGSRRVLWVNVTRHPTAQWTRQQLREAIPADHEYRVLIHDRDNIFSPELDHSVRNLGLRVVKTPYRSPQANAFCERLIGSLRRECLDWLIPLNESHLRRLVSDWVNHYNHGRPHMGLGPGVPDPPVHLPADLQTVRHRIADGYGIVSRAVLGGLCHEYGLAKTVA